MARADVDHNGKLDLAEFILMMHNNQLEMMDQDDEQVRKMIEMKQAFRFEILSISNRRQNFLTLGHLTPEGMEKLLFRI